MPFSEEATQLTKSLVEGKDVRLVVSKERDMHGRLVAYVYVDGRDVSLSLLDEGYAAMRFSNLSSNPYNAEEYREAQNSASSNKKGLWQIDGYADPEKESGFKKRGAMEKYLELMGKGEVE